MPKNREKLLPNYSREFLVTQGPSPIYSRRRGLRSGDTPITPDVHTPSERQATSLLRVGFAPPHTPQNFWGSSSELGTSARWAQSSCVSIKTGLHKRPDTTCVSLGTHTYPGEAQPSHAFPQLAFVMTLDGVEASQMMVENPSTSPVFGPLNKPRLQKKKRVCPGFFFFFFEGGVLGGVLDLENPSTATQRGCGYPASLRRVVPFFFLLLVCRLHMPKLYYH